MNSYYITTALICLLVAAFFSAAETSLTGVSKAYLLHQKQQGSKRAQMLNKMISDSDNLITSLLIGNNFFNIFFTTLTTSLLIELYGNQNTLIIGLVITFIVLAFSEILPKTYAFSNPNRIAILLAPLVYVIVTILRPVSFIFLTLNRLFLSILTRGHNHNKSSKIGTLDNLRGAIEMLEREDESSFTSQEKEMLHSILDLNELTVSSIMNHRKNMFCIDINDPTTYNLTKIVNSAYTRIPVFDNQPENIIGILNLKDVFKAYIKEKDLNKVNLHTLLHSPYFIPESTTVIDLLATFKEKQERIALIVDEYGSFMGILTLGDILEEITGELRNKEQIHVSDHIQKVDNSYIVDGDYKIRDLNRKMSWKLPDETFTTIAGLILFETGKIPNVNNIFVFHNFRFEILEKKRHQLIKIKITPLSNKG